MISVLFIGEDRERSSPLGTWATALESLGVKCLFANPASMGLQEWLRLLRSIDVIVLQIYGVGGDFLRRQLCLAAIFGVPVIRKWSGTDVLYCVTREDAKREAERIDRILSANLCSEHTGLIDELESVGLAAKLIPQVVAFRLDWKTPVRPDLGASVLLYLPSKRLDFYNIHIMEEIVALNPDLNFIVIADETHALRKYPNVDSLGWVGELETVWGRVGVLVRTPKHDGFSRMIVEALYRQKYVITNRPIDGCWFASTVEEINTCLKEFRQLKLPNQIGREALHHAIGDKPQEVLLAELVAAKAKFTARVHAVVQFFVVQLALSRN